MTNVTLHTYLFPQMFPLTIVCSVSTPMGLCYLDLLFAHKMFAEFPFSVWRLCIHNFAHHFTKRHLLLECVVLWWVGLRGVGGMVGAR